MKKKLVSFLAFLLVFCTVISFASCSTEQNGTNTPGTTTDDTNTDNSDTDDTADNTDNNTDNVGDNNADNKPEEIPEVDTREEISKEALIETLVGSIYSANVKTNEFIGLSDPSLVGMNEAKRSEELYAVPDDADFAKIINVQDHGITPDSTDCSTEFTTLVKSLKNEEGLKKLVFPEGEYKFNRTLVFEDLEDIYVCSDGDDKRFSITIMKWCPGIRIVNCKNFHLNNCDFDYAYPSAITGTVASNTGNTVVIDIDEGYDLTHSNYGGAGYSMSRYGFYLEHTYDEMTGTYIPNRKGNLVFNCTTMPQLNAIKSGTYNADTNQMTLNFVEGKFKPVEPGVRVSYSYTYYEYTAFGVVGGENIYLESFNLYHAMGMAMTFDEVKNVYLNRVMETLKEGRLMVGTADGLHASSCRGEMVITNSTFERTLDDSFNIKGGYGKVVANTPKSVSYDTSKEIYVEVGDVLDFYSTSNFEYLGSFTVKKVDKDKSKYDFVESMGDLDLSGAYIANDTQINSLTVQNCYFGNKRSRCMLIQCRDVLIEGCTFQNILNGTFLIHSISDIFAEGIVPRNVVIKNNKFMANRSGDVRAYTSGPDGRLPNTITGIEVTNNFFYRGSAVSVGLESVGSSTVANNFVYAIQASVTDVIYIDDSQDILVEGNYILGSSSNEELDPILVKKDKTSNITLKDNVIDISEPQD